MCNVGGLLGGALGVATGGFGLGLGALAGGSLGGAVGGAITGGGFKGVIPGALTGAGVGGVSDIIGWGGTQAAAPITEAGTQAVSGGQLVAPDFVGPLPADTFGGMTAGQQLMTGMSDLGGGILRNVGSFVMPGAGGNIPNATGPIMGTNLGTILNLGTGLYGLQQAEQLRKLAALQAAQVDPMASQRSMYAGQLASLQANPNQITSMPGYQAAMQAAQRSSAAQGYQGSGNMMASMAQAGGNFYQQQLQNLMQLSGATNMWAPGQAGQLAYQGANESAAASMMNLNRLGLGLNTMGY